MLARVRELLWRSLPKFLWAGSLRGWLYVVVRNESARLQADPFARRATSFDAEGDHGEDNRRQRTETAPYRKTDVKQAFLRLRDQLTEDDRLLLLLRVDRNLDWSDVARAMAGHDTPPDPRDVARLRKRFQRVKERLRTLAVNEGLLSP